MIQTNGVSVTKIIGICVLAIVVTLALSVTIIAAGLFFMSCEIVPCLFSLKED